MSINHVYTRTCFFTKNSQNFKGACFVTGGSKGIGKNIAVSICQKFKMPVALVGRDLKSLEQAANECAQFVPREQVLTFAFDVRDNDAMKKAIDGTARQLGGITVLVCSAGINRRRAAISNDGLKFADPKLWFVCSFFQGVSISLIKPVSGKSSLISMSTQAFLPRYAVLFRL